MEMASHDIFLMPWAHFLGGNTRVQKRRVFDLHISKAGVPREYVRILTLPQNKDFRLPCAAKMFIVEVVSNTMHLRHAVGPISQLSLQRP